MDEPIREPLASELLALLKEGQKIEAIKKCREATGLGLKESKEAVERYAAQVEREQPGLLPKASGCGAAALLLVALPVALACLWFGG